MKVILKLRFHTRLGQWLSVTGHHPALGHGADGLGLPMEYVNDDFWQVTFALSNKSAAPNEEISYHYVLHEADGSRVIEEGGDRTLGRELFAGNEVLIVDTWNAAGHPGNAFCTEPFREVLLRESRTTFRGHAPARSTHTFRVTAPLLAAGQSLCLIGSAESLGRWDTARALPLSRLPGECYLAANVNLAGESFPMEYKYAVYDTVQQSFVHYEGGGNRRLEEPPVSRRRIVVQDGFARLPVETWKGAGVALPVFALRSESSFGVGEFTDLRLLVDWCRRVGLKLIQILPVNDTTATHTWVDSYPYAAISAFALHPIYLNLGRVATGRRRALLKEAERERRRLNALPTIDYEAVMRAKLAWIKRLYRLEKAATFRSRPFRLFFSENKHWLVPYAVYCSLRDRYGTADFNQWPLHRHCGPAELRALSAPRSPDYDAVALHYFVQFHLHTQLRESAAYAREQGVVLKGDIAIGVSRHGADTWQQPGLFHLGMQAGAPPDPFADKGQNWGFPTYDWPRMMQDGFSWWKRRFAQMAHYFDAFRIDHILGFFRIWSIPAHSVEGILGYFVPAIPVGLDEFAGRGMAVDRARLVEPFITDTVLEELFGPAAEAVKREFLRPASAGQYTLRPAFATQRQVEQHFANLPDTPQNQRLRAGLFDLISNVILLEVAGEEGKEFHFRFHMDRTASFRDLDSWTQEQLYDLYVDYFFRRQDGFWRRQAMQKLPALKRVTDMLICGEDLGLVPACVPGVMKELGLLGLEIQRMPKAPGLAFSHPSAAPYLSVVTPSTHDMSTIRGWWTEDIPLIQRFYHEELGRPGPAPAECSGELNEAVVRRHLDSPAMWSIFQLQDLLGSDERLRRPDPDAERINVPANPRHYWRYRMQLTLEDLLKADGFNHRLRDLVRQSGR